VVLAVGRYLPVYTSVTVVYYNLYQYGYRYYQFFVGQIALSFDDYELTN